MEKWQKKSRIERYGGYLGLISLIITVIVAPITIIYTVQAADSAKEANDLTKQSLLDQEQANNLTQTSLYLQNITSNFQPEIISYYITANIGDIHTNAPTDEFGEISDSGSLNMSLVVITPHAAILNFSDTSFMVYVRTVTNSNDWINSSNYNTPSVYLTPQLPFGESGFNYNSSAIQIIGLQYYNYWPEAFVQPGVTQVNFTIAIHATIPLNSNFTGVVIGTSIGIIGVQANLLDVQTNRIATTYNYSVPIMLNINV